MMEQYKILSPIKIATDATVTRWIKKGVIKGVIRPAHAQNWRIPLSSAEELIKHHESR